MLRRTHLSAPADLPRVVAEEAALIGATDVRLYLADYEQTTLIPLDGGLGPTEELSVAGTIAGRVFSGTTILRTPAEREGHERLWLPLLDGTERVGVIGMTFASDTLSEDLVAVCERFAHMAAMFIVTKGAYTDVFERVRRRRPMTIASELAWSLAPPTVFGTDGLAVAMMLEPAYDNGGDAVDYAVNAGVLHVGIFDAMGHGLAAAGVAAFALAAYRNSRRNGCDLLETHAIMDEAVGQQFPDERFVTALVAQLELESGSLRWISAGHPPPLLVRGERHASTLTTAATPPLGVGVPGAHPEVATTSLEPGDFVLFYTDGLVDARLPDGSVLSLDVVSEFIEREAGAGGSVPETLRRLRNTLVADQQVDLRDDATALLLRWHGGDEQALLPPTVPGN